MAGHPLDNHMWNALNGAFARYARAVGDVRLLAPDIGPAVAIPANTPEALATLASAIPTGAEVFVIFPQPMAATAELELVLTKPLSQMVAERPLLSAPNPAVRALGPADFPQMLALVAITEPGPLGPRALEIGGYLGIFDGDLLVALAGERLRFAGFTEVATVCTHPDYRGRDNAKAVVSALMRGIIARGETPFLGVDADNIPAIRLYERLGFVHRSTFHFSRMRRR